MKRLIVFLGCIILSAYAASAQHNILKNPGFEEWDSIPGTRPY
jgi:hypothetical protein